MGWLKELIAELCNFLIDLLKLAFQVVLVLRNHCFETLVATLTSKSNFLLFLQGSLVYSRKKKQNKGHDLIE